MKVVSSSSSALYLYRGFAMSMTPTAYDLWSCFWTLNGLSRETGRLYYFHTAVLITINQLLFVLGGHRLVTKQRLCDDPVWNTIVSRTQRTATAAGTTEIKISLSLSTGHRGCQVSDWYYINFGSTQCWVFMFLLLQQRCRPILFLSMPMRRSSTLWITGIKDVYRLTLRGNEQLQTQTVRTDSSKATFHGSSFLVTSSWQILSCQLVTKKLHLWNMQNFVAIR